MRLLYILSFSLATLVVGLTAQPVQASTYVSGGVAFGHPSPHHYRHHRYSHYPRYYSRPYYAPRYYVVEPQPVYIQPQPAQLAAPQPERYCREYTREVTVAGKKQESFGQACMQPNGSWEIVN